MKKLMKKLMKAAAIAAIGLAIPLLAASEERPQPNGNSIWVARDTVTSEIVDREPLNDGAAFSPAMGPVYYFTEVQGDGTPTHITHIWYYEGQQMAQIPLSVEGPRWRTWSSKQILQDWTGSWRVEAVDADGHVLSSQTFEIH